MPRLLQVRGQYRQGCLRAQEQGPGLQHVEFRGLAVLELYVDDLEAALLACDVVLCDADLVLDRTDREIDRGPPAPRPARLRRPVPPATRDRVHRPPRCRARTGPRNRSPSWPRCRGRTAGTRGRRPTVLAAFSLAEMPVAPPAITCDCGYLRPVAMPKAARDSSTRRPAISRSLLSASARSTSPIEFRVAEELPPGGFFLRRGRQSGDLGLVPIRAERRFRLLVVGTDRHAGGERRCGGRRARCS